LGAVITDADADVSVDAARSRACPRARDVCDGVGYPDPDAYAHCDDAGGDGARSGDEHCE
jgi:hypothetical protein